MAVTCLRLILDFLVGVKAGVAFNCAVVTIVEISGVIQEVKEGAGNVATPVLKWLNHVHPPRGQQGNISNTTA